MDLEPFAAEYHQPTSEGSTGEDLIPPSQPDLEPAEPPSEPASSMPPPAIIPDRKHKPPVAKEEALGMLEEEAS